MCGTLAVRGETTVMDNMPTSTRLTIEASPVSGEAAIRSVYMIYSSATQQKGTGFLLANGRIITNWHVTRGSKASTLLAISAFDEHIQISDVIEDPIRDIACLQPAKAQEGGFTVPSPTSTPYHKFCSSVRQFYFSRSYATAGTCPAMSSRSSSSASRALLVFFSVPPAFATASM